MSKYLNAAAGAAASLFISAATPVATTALIAVAANDANAQTTCPPGQVPIPGDRNGGCSGGPTTQPQPTQRQAQEQQQQQQQQQQQTATARAQARASATGGAGGAGGAATVSGVEGGAGGNAIASGNGGTANNGGVSISNNTRYTPAAASAVAGAIITSVHHCAATEGWSLGLQAVVGGASVSRAQATYIADCAADNAAVRGLEASFALFQADPRNPNAMILTAAAVRFFGERFPEYRASARNTNERTVECDVRGTLQRGEIPSILSLADNMGSACVSFAAAAPANSPQQARQHVAQIPRRVRAPQAAISCQPAHVQVIELRISAGQANTVRQCPAAPAPR